VPGYEAKEVWLDPDVVKKLDTLQEIVRGNLIENGFSTEMANNIHIIVKDGYRPHKATHAMADWAKRNNVSRAYVAANISGHNKGKVLDATLGYRMKDGTIREIWLGSRFDEFNRNSNHGSAGRKLDPRRDNPSSYQGLGYITANRYPITKLRNILKASMKAVGGKSYQGEYWHYSFGGGKCYDHNIN